MLESFIKQFTTKTIPYIQIGEGFYLQNKYLEKICFTKKQPILFGCFLGKITNDTFSPSFPLLDLLSDYTNEKIIVNQWGEIDFLYGKNLRKRHIIDIKGSMEPSCLKLVLNKYDECLGYGVFIGISDKKVQILKHILDRGIFIKRDKNQGQSY